ncbi:MAG TPA: AbrB/MazE/SpoVT family DNA-binding domain-containing protein [Candidatus Aphodousia faecavium]|nr:AbrB/MazE/SpoVT family DNA-binding domain-containing protein [Candidatus Aphodousia faecavium]
MELVVKKWGNSLGIRLPTSIKKALNVTENSKLLVKLTPEGLMVKKAPSLPAYSLDSLLKKIDDKNQHRDFDDGVPTGKEVW